MRLDVSALEEDKMGVSEGKGASILVAAAAGTGPIFSRDTLLCRVFPTKGWRECGDGGRAAVSSSWAVAPPSGAELKDGDSCR